MPATSAEEPTRAEEPANEDIAAHWLFHARVRLDRGGDLGAVSMPEGSLQDALSSSLSGSPVSYPSV
jgi:hydroxypyruvate isomerase